MTAATLFGVGVAATRGRQSAMEFFAGSARRRRPGPRRARTRRKRRYLVEQSLSVDNLFVFILLFEYFKVPAALQQRALKWGAARRVPKPARARGTRPSQASSAPSRCAAS